MKINKFNLIFVLLYFLSGGLLAEIDINFNTDAPAKLNDTGITWGGDYPSGNNADCTGEEISAQDCSHGRDAQATAGTLAKIGAGDAGFDFTKLDANGNALDASATAWSCVKDNHTGLVWEVKTTDGGIHDKGKKYRWGGLTAQGRDHLNKEGEYYDVWAWNTLVEDSNNDGFCGFTTGWRVPNRHELRSIVHLGGTNLTIDTAYFPNTALKVWSSSPYVSNSKVAWYVSFDYGKTDYLYRMYNLQVRLVRSGE